MGRPVKARESYGSASATVLRIVTALEMDARHDPGWCEETVRAGRRFAALLADPKPPEAPPGGADGDSTD